MRSSLSSWSPDFLAALEPVAKQIKATEGLIDRTRKRLEAIENELANPALYERDSAKVATLGKERSELADQLARHEELWLTLSAQYEEGMAQ